MEKIKILLVNPPYIKYVYSGYKGAVAVNIPLGLACLGGILEKNSISVEALDANVMELSIKETAEHILKNESRYIFLTTTSNTITKVYEIIRLVKLSSNKKIIVGGPHVTFEPERSLRECPYIDIVVRGEGEYTALELAQKEFRDLESIRGITYWSGQQIKSNPDRERIQNLDELPFPARHLFPFKLYRQGAFFNTGIKNKETAVMNTARGCPNRCKYCASVHFWGTTVKFRSAENMVQEIEHLQKEYRTKQIAFLDDMFTAHPPRLKEFCGLLIKKKIKIRWWCYSRINTLDKDLMKLMKKAGCYALNFGVESGNEEILKRINKNITKKKTWEVFQAAKELGLLVHASFMVGLPGDNKETTRQTINWAIKLNPHIALFCITTPFPGTELHQEAIQNGWMDQVKSWDDVGLHMKTKYHNDDLSSEEIYHFYKLAQRKFFYRFGFFWSNFKRLLMHPNEIKGYLMAGLYLITER